MILHHLCINMAVNFNFKLPSLLFNFKNFNFKLPTKRNAKPDHGLPCFCWDDVAVEKEVDSGAFGTVYLGNYARTEEKVVIKKLRGESTSQARVFIPSRATAKTLVQAGHVTPPNLPKSGRFLISVLYAIKRGVAKYNMSLSCMSEPLHGNAET